MSDAITAPVLAGGKCFSTYFFMFHFKIFEEKSSIMKLMGLTETLPIFSLVSLSHNPVQPFPEYIASPNPSKCMASFDWQCDKQSYKRNTRKVFLLRQI